MCSMDHPSDAAAAVRQTRRDIVIAMGRIALVLGSGGARGYAHIGAIEVLEEHGHEVVTVAGSSMGALIGGLYSAGKLGEFTVWALGLRQFDILRLVDPAVGAAGLVRAQRVTRHLSDMLGGMSIEDARIPYTAVATDLGSRREVWFQQGPMDVAIRASIAMPSLITPVVVGDRLLIDGGVVNPLPIEPTLAVAADLTVAVNLNGPSGAPSQSKDPATSTPFHASADETPVGQAWLDRFRRGASDLLAQSPLQRKKVEPSTPDLYRLDQPPKDLSYLDLLTQTVDMMSTIITRYRTSANAPDVTIQVPHDACRVTDFHRAEEMVALGRRLTEEALARAGL